MKLLLALVLFANGFEVLRFGVCDLAGGWGREQDGPPPSASRKVAPDFLVKDIYGQPVRLSDYEGKVVLLDFWATWCPPCRMSTPLLVDLQERYGEKGLVVIGVNVKESAEKVEAYMAKEGITYPMIIDDGDIIDAFRVRGYPTFVLIGKDGAENLRLWGFHPDYPARLAGAVETALSR